MLAAGPSGEDRETLVTMLEAVAVWTRVRAGPPHIVEARDVGHLVEHARGEDDRARQLRGVGPSEADRAVETLGGLDVGGHDLDPVASQFRASAGAQVRRVQA